MSHNQNERNEYCAAISHNDTRGNREYRFDYFSYL
jgi:hypothetical protein